jgi:hypothetical protein
MCITVWLSRPPVCLWVPSRLVSYLVWLHHHWPPLRVWYKLVINLYLYQVKLHLYDLTAWFRSNHKLSNLLEISKASLLFLVDSPLTILLLLVSSPIIAISPIYLIKTEIDRHLIILIHCLLATSRLAIILMMNSTRSAVLSRFWSKHRRRSRNI